MSKQPISDRLITVIGIIFVLVYLLAFWIPVRCPLLRKLTSTCPAHSGATSVILTPEQKILAEYPHQQVENNYAFFDVNSQDDRSHTTVHFAYYSKNIDHVVATLQLKTPDGLIDQALISHPLLLNLSWQKIIDNSLVIYQKNPTYSSVPDFFKNLPPASQIAADTEAATAYGLKTGQYTPLESLTNLDTITAVVTSRLPVQKDGDWYIFTERFDLQKIQPSKNNTLGWAIHFNQGVDPANPFYLGIVHIDYADR